MKKTPLLLSSASIILIIIVIACSKVSRSGIDKEPEKTPFQIASRTQICPKTETFHSYTYESDTCLGGFILGELTITKEFDCEDNLTSQSSNPDTIMHNQCGAMQSPNPGADTAIFGTPPTNPPCNDFSAFLIEYRNIDYFEDPANHAFLLVLRRNDAMINDLLQDFDPSIFEGVDDYGTEKLWAALLGYYNAAFQGYADVVALGLPFSSLCESAAAKKVAHAAGAVAYNPSTPFATLEDARDYFVNEILAHRI